MENYEVQLDILINGGQQLRNVLGDLQELREAARGLARQEINPRLEIEGLEAQRAKLERLRNDYQETIRFSTDLEELREAARQLVDIEGTLQGINQRLIRPRLQLQGIDETRREIQGLEQAHERYAQNAERLNRRAAGNIRQSQQINAARSNFQRASARVESLPMGQNEREQLERAVAGFRVFSEQRNLPGMRGAIREIRALGDAFEDAEKNMQKFQSSEELFNRRRGQAQRLSAMPANRGGMSEALRERAFGAMMSFARYQQSGNADGMSRAATTMGRTLETDRQDARQQAFQALRREKNLDLNPRIERLDLNPRVDFQTIERIEAKQARFNRFADAGDIIRAKTSLRSLERQVKQIEQRLAGEDRQTTRRIDINRGINSIQEKVNGTLFDQNDAIAIGNRLEQARTNLQRGRLTLAEQELKVARGLADVAKERRAQETRDRADQTALERFSGSVQQAGNSLGAWERKLNNPSEAFFGLEPRSRAPMPKALQGDGLTADEWLQGELEKRKEFRRKAGLAGPTPETKNAIKLEEFREKTIQENAEELAKFNRLVEQAGMSLQAWTDKIENPSEALWGLGNKPIGPMPKALQGDGLSAEEWLSGRLAAREKSQKEFQKSVRATQADNRFAEMYGPQAGRSQAQLQANIESIISSFVKLSGQLGSKANAVQSQLSRGGTLLPNTMDADTLRGGAANAVAEATGLRQLLDAYAQDPKANALNEQIIQKANTALSQYARVLEEQSALISRAPKPATTSSGSGGKGATPADKLSQMADRLERMGGSLGTKANKVETQLQRGGTILPGTAGAGQLRKSAEDVTAQASNFRRAAEAFRAGAWGAKELQTIFPQIVQDFEKWQQYFNTQTNLINRAPKPPTGGGSGGAGGSNPRLVRAGLVTQLDGLDRQARLLARESHANAAERLSLTKAENQLTQARIALEDGNYDKLNQLAKRAQNNLGAAKQGQETTGGFSLGRFSRRVQNLASGRADDKQLENLMLGVGFPMMFGGGAGSIIGSGIGSFIGSGFGGQIAGGAIGMMIEQSVVSVKELNDAFMQAGDSYAAIRATGLEFSSELEKQVVAAKRLGNFDQAKQLEDSAITMQTGDLSGNITEATAASVSALEVAWNGFYKAISTTLGILAAPFLMALAAILRLFQFIFMIVNLIVSAVGELVEMVGLKNLFEGWNQSLMMATGALQDQRAEMDKQISSARSLNRIAEEASKREIDKLGLKGAALEQYEKETQQAKLQAELEKEIADIRKEGKRGTLDKTELLVAEKRKEFEIRSRTEVAQADRKILEARIADQQRYEDLVLSAQAGALAITRKIFDLESARIDLARQEADLITQAEDMRLKVADQLFERQQQLAALRIESARREVQLMADTLDLANKIASSSVEDGGKQVLDAASEAAKIQIEGQAETNRDRLSMELEVDKLQRDQRNQQRQLMREIEQFERQVEALIRARVNYERQLEDFKIQVADYQRKIARETLQLWMEAFAQMNALNQGGGGMEGTAGNSVMAAFDRIRGAYQFRSANTTGEVVKGAIQPEPGSNKYFQFMPQLKSKVFEELKKLTTTEIRAAVFTGLGEAKSGSVDDFFNVVANILTRKAKTGQNVVDLVLAPRQYEANEIRGATRRTFDSDAWGKREFGARYTSMLGALQGEVMRANTAQSPTASGAAYFGATGNTNGYIHGHFQTMAGVEALIQDVFPVLKQLVQQGIPLEISGRTNLRGLTDAQLMAEMRRGIAVHKKYPSGAVALDVGVPPNTLVPGGVEDVGPGTRNGGIEGFLAGTNKRTIVSHLAPGSRSGGGGAGATAAGMNLILPVIPELTSVPQPVAGRELDALTRGKLGDPPSLTGVFAEDKKIMDQKAEMLKIAEKERELARQKALEAVRLAAAGTENVLQARQGLNLESAKLVVTSKSGELSENQAALNLLDVDASQKILNLKEQQRNVLSGIEEQQKRMEAALIKEGVPAEKAKSDAAKAYKDILEQINEGNAIALQKAIEINAIEKERLATAQKLATVQEAANNIRSLRTLGRGTLMGMGGAYASAFEAQINRGIPEDQARKFGDAARITERQQKAISDSEGISKAFSDSLKQILNGADIKEVFSSFFQKISDTFLDRAFEPLENFLSGQLFNLLQVSPGKVANTISGLEGVAESVAMQAAAQGFVTSTATAGAAAIAFATQLQLAAGLAGASGSVASLGSALPGSLITSIFTGGIGGFFADGGRPPLGRPSVVGENGWELWWPDAAGTILNQDQIADAFVPSKNQMIPGSGQASIYDNIDQSRISRKPEPVPIDYTVREERGERYVTERDFLQGLRQMGEYTKGQTVTKLKKSTSTRREVGI